MLLYFTLFHFSARVSILKGGGYIYTKMCSNLLSSFQLGRPQTHQLTVASAQLQEVLTDLKEQSGGLRAFTQLNKTSLCVQRTDRRCHRRRMGQQSPPRTLRIWTQDACAAFSDTCRGPWMSLWWDRGTGMVTNTQSFIRRPWHCSHSDTDTHWDTKTQLPQVADLQTTLDSSATQLHLALLEEGPLYTSLAADASCIQRREVV